MIQDTICTGKVEVVSGQWFIILPFIDDNDINLKSHGMTSGQGEHTIWKTRTT